VFTDLAEGFGEVTVEAAAQRDPEAFVVNFYQGGPAAQDKIDLLTRLLPNSPAAQAGRAVGVDDAALNEGVRNADAVAQIARALHPDAF
jgi:iron complex transport system substrate-binding protein